METIDWTEQEYRDLGTREAEEDLIARFLDQLLLQPKPGELARLMRQALKGLHALWDIDNWREGKRIRCTSMMNQHRRIANPVYQIQKYRHSQKKDCTTAYGGHTTDEEAKKLGITYKSGEGTLKFEYRCKEARIRKIEQIKAQEVRDAMPKDPRRVFTLAQKRELYEQANGRCHYCGCELGDDWHADHYEPWSLGGRTEIENGRTACPECNHKKYATPGPEFEAQDAMRRLQKASS
ncbi:MAG: HNH endonuclease [bacterium]|nr:HNH endonuclease [bacterium]